MYVCVCGWGGGRGGVSVHINNSLTTISPLYVRDLGGPNFGVDDGRLAIGVHTLDITISTEFGQVLRVLPLTIIIPGLFNGLAIYLSSIAMHDGFHFVPSLQSCHSCAFHYWIRIS